MIALLIGGTVVLCIGILTVVFGIPIKEFSLGNTMILAGSIVSCTGLVLLGLYFVCRELRNVARVFDGSGATAAPAAPRDKPESPPKLSPGREDTLFTRDQPPDLPPVRDAFADPEPPESLGRASSPLAAAAPPSWQDHPVNRARLPAMPADAFEPPAKPAERPRRNIMFSSHRRGADRDAPPPEETAQRPVADEAPDRESESRPADPFDSAWPQPTRPRAEPSTVRTDRPVSEAAEADSAPEALRERFQPPRRADESAVTVVKSGVVDSMAYSLYSDGSIEAQMPEGMVRFASIDDLRAHLDERG